jgi:gliding motility-associated-like protein
VNQEPGLDFSKIPNVFTPNGDNLNDEFVMAANENILHLTIFDRWGQKVFESSEQVKTWNGKKESTILNEGTYYYVAELTDCSNQVVSVKGTVYLKK